MTIDLTSYEESLWPARARIMQSRWATEVLAPGTSPEALERFLLQFCSLGVAMTRPVEGWIRRAGERCIETGLPDLGHALIRHARHEADHDQMMIRDTHALVSRQRRAGRRVLAAAVLLARAPTPGVTRYLELHEQILTGPAPCAHIAVEHEIERLSMIHGPAFARRCVATLGGDIREALSFIEDNAALDVGRAKASAAQLGRLIERRPDLLDPLVAAGSAALDAYSAFLDDCLDLAAEPPSAPPLSARAA